MPLVLGRTGVVGLRETSGSWFLRLRQAVSGAAVHCRERAIPSGAMLPDYDRVHNSAGRTVGRAIRIRHDYMSGIMLRLELRETIGPERTEWNDFDRLTPHTKMLLKHAPNHAVSKNQTTDHFKPAGRIQADPDMRTANAIPG